MMRKRLWPFILLSLTASCSAEPDINHPAQFVGKWTPLRDCSRALMFKADGTFEGPTDIRGTWLVVEDGPSTHLVMGLEGDRNKNGDVRNMTERGFDLVDDLRKVHMTRCP